ncbi:hypothetical protein H9N25_08080 [Pedobacter riviphilus]|uniref:Uncharacterized protein n=1 Tax=Pedobacter riviphilus TaxID=2766984 RepID=A0ABX6TMB9_9SPHI|nr:hypothetical protein [Pedobacter riviphilus]QNR86346.1 hypothetical protein H9N25_08080 [Pedobacter riviphilus]
MITINDKLPTSTLLDLKVGDEITNGNDQSGKIKNIEISETDEFLLFLFQLENNKIIIRKLKQVC